MTFRLGSVFVAFLCLSASAVAANLDQYLVARWTFNDGSLKAEKGGYVLRTVVAGSDPLLTFENGQVRLGRGMLLVCEDISSATKPGLANEITIWARLRLDTAAPQAAFLFGLRDLPEPGDWRNMVLAVLARDKPVDTTLAFSRFSSGAQLGSPSNSTPITPGKFVSVAMVFDGMAKTVTYIVDGRAFEVKHQDADRLGDFDNFAIGRLKEAAAVAMTVDEIRVYSVAISPEWVADIAPVK